MSGIGTNNIREYILNPILGYTMVIIDNWHNTGQIGWQDTSEYE